MSMSQKYFLSLGPDGFLRRAYTDWGNPRNPHVVICVHGLSRNSREFDRLVAATGEVEAHFALRYFNSSSTKLIRSMIALMHESAQAGKRIVTHWYHDPDDDMMSEFGNDLKDEFRMLDIRVEALEMA